MFSFLEVLSFTTPETPITYSDLKDFAFSRSASGISSLNVIWVIPDLSLMSTNTRPPRLLALATHPFRTTLVSTSSSLSSPHMCVLFSNVDILSFNLLSYIISINFFLFAAYHILECNDTLFDLVIANHNRVTCS